MLINQPSGSRGSLRNDGSSCMKSHFFRLTDLSCELKPDTLAPKFRISKIFAWNTLTSTANHSASTNAMNKLRTYSERSSSSPYFIFSGFNDQWKCRFSTDYVIAYRSSLYLSVDRCMTLNISTYLPPLVLKKKIQFWYYTVKRFMFYLPKILRSKKMW